MVKKIIATPKWNIIILLFLLLCFTFGLSIAFYAKSDARLFLFFFIAFIVYGIYHIVRTFKFLKINKDIIRCGFHSKYNYSDIKQVELYGYVDYRFLFFPMKEECLTIMFEDGKKVSLQDYYYTNLWKIRWVLENKIIKNNNTFDFNFNLDFNSDVLTNKTPPIATFTRLTPYLFYFFLTSFIINVVLIYFDVQISQLLVLISFLGLLTLLIFHGKSYYMESNNRGVVIKNLVFKHAITKLPIS